MFDLIKKVYIESKNNIEGEELSKIPQMKSITQFKIKNFWLFNFGGADSFSSLSLTQDVPASPSFSSFYSSSLMCWMLLVAAASIQANLSWVQ